MSDLLRGSLPAELKEPVERILRAEPEHRSPDLELPPNGQRPRTLRSFLAPSAGPLTLAFLLVLLGTVAQNAGPLIVARAVDRGILPKNFSLLLVLTAVYLGTIAAGMLLKYLSNVYTGRLGQRLMARLRVQVFSHLQDLSLDFYIKEKSGRLMANMTSDIEALSNLLQDGLINIAAQGATLLVIVCALFSMNALLATILLLTVVPLMAAATWWSRRAGIPAHLEVRNRTADLMTDFRESLAGVRAMTAHNRRADHVVRHRDIVRRYRLATDETIRVSAVYTSATEIASLLGQVVIVAAGYQMVLRKNLTEGELIAFVLFLRRFFSPIQMLLGLQSSYLAGRAAVVKLTGLLAQEPSVRDSPGALPLPTVTGDVRLQSVSFEHRPGTPVLRSVDLHIRAGETVAFVGTTGAGKSTLAKLLVRLYDPAEGRILIDGTDLRDVTSRSLRSQVGFVPQEPFLFHGSIRENVTFAKPGAAPEEVEQACSAVGLDAMALGWRQGLDTPCHESGISLSSGQKQLISLARVFLVQPRILILDEATSRLDLQTEARIEAALDRLLHGRTAILIAHRLATVQRADRIAVLERGEILELGSPVALREKGGAYSALLKVFEKTA